MSSGPKHYEIAEDLLQSLVEMHYTPEQEDRIVRRARVHAMLANTMANARVHGNVDSPGWNRVSQIKREYIATPEEVAADAAIEAARAAD